MRCSFANAALQKIVTTMERTFTAPVQIYVMFDHLISRFVIVGV
jgi:hypothetical protein